MATNQAPPRGAGYRIIQSAPRELVFPRRNRTDLRKDPDDEDEVAIMLAQQYPETVHLFRFVSHALISCRETARKNIQLRFDDQTIFKHLPNPSYRNITRHTYEQGRQEVTQDALFHVIRYINPPL